MWTNDLLSTVWLWSVLIASISEEKTARKILWGHFLCRDKSDVLCFRDNAGDIIGKYWDERKDNTDDSKSFVVAAAKILISELRSKTDFDVIHYPNSGALQMLRATNYGYQNY